MMSRRAILVLAAVLAASSGCGGLYPGERKRLNQCGEILTRLEREAHALPTAAVPGLRLQAAELQTGKTHPHGGVSVCYYAGLVPNGWNHSTEPLELHPMDPTLVWTSPASDRGSASLRYTLTGGSGPERLADYIERVELAPARLRGDLHRASNGRTVNSREHRRLIVSREDGAVHLRMLRWRADVEDNFYLRCEAVLTGEYEASVPLFEAICDALRVRHWDYSW